MPPHPMLERSKARRQALNILYQREITGEPASRILDDGSYSSEGGEPSDFCRELVLGVEANQPRIDEVISATSENWSIGRMPLVDRSILRIAVFEILYAEDIPDSVSINEAVELAKNYGGDDSSKFVNGVLGRLAAQHATGDGAEQGSDG